MSNSPDPLSLPEKWDSSTVLGALALTADDAIIVLDEGRGICFYNHGAERIFGWRADEMLGKPLDILIPERFRAKHKQHIRQFASEPTAARTMGSRSTICGLRANGQEFPAEASIARFFVGERRYFGVILRDVTQLVEARREIERLKGLLPVCAYCRKVRDDSGYWQELEQYLESHSNLSVTHGICKECLAKVMPAPKATSSDLPPGSPADRPRS